jgi:diguanylate cyclase (GGDEF)-like protein
MKNGGELSPLEDLRRHSMALEKAISLIALITATAEELEEQKRELNAQVQELEEQNQEKDQMLYIDSDTGLYNRRAFFEALPTLTEIARRNSEPLALMDTDIDGLKRVNDELGHAKGDELILTVAEAIKYVARGTDPVYRLGGDEIAVIFPGFRPMPGETLESLTTDTLERYNALALSEIKKLDIPESLHVGVSIALTQFRHGESADSLVRRADNEMYEIKKAKRTELEAKGVVFGDSREIISA